MIRIPDKHLNDYLLASLGYSGTDRWHNFLSVEEGFEENQDASLLLGKASALYLRAVGSGTSHVPFFLVMDLRLLSEFGFEFTYAERELDGFDPLLRARYENEILNRLLREHSVEQALELLAFHKARTNKFANENEAFDQRADRLTDILLSRLAAHWPQEFVVNAAHMRGRDVEVSSLSQLTDSLNRWTTTALALDPESSSFEEMLTTFIHSATGSRRKVVPVNWTHVVETQDLFELEHIEALDHEYLRLGVRQIIEVMETLPALDPHDVDLREENSEVESRFMDDSYYPTGGFSEITNKGSFENLVLSELIYMGEGTTGARDEVIGDIKTGIQAQNEGENLVKESGGEDKRKGIDLFDLRFVEGELLFYTRDSGQLFRKRRMLRLIIDMRQTLDIKFPEHKYQLRTMVAGLVLALVRDLTFLFHKDALLFELQLYASEEEVSVQKLADTMAILLQSPIQRGTLNISVVSHLHLMELGLKTRKTYALFFTSDQQVARQLAARVDELRSSNPPLFPTVIDLSTNTGQSLSLDHVLRLEMNSRALIELKHEILLEIMHCHRKVIQNSEL